MSEDTEVDGVAPCVDVRGAARWARTSPALIRREIAARRLRAFRVGHLVRITMDALREYAAAHGYDGARGKRNPWGCRGRPETPSDRQAVAQ